MQPIHTTRIPDQVIPTPKRIFGHKETASYPLKTASGTAASRLPEDVVTLSGASAAGADPSRKANPNPSVPMTPDERKALQISFSVYA